MNPSMNLSHHHMSSLHYSELNLLSVAKNCEQNGYKLLQIGLMWFGPMLSFTPQPYFFLISLENMFA